MSDIKTFNTVSALKYWCYKILPLVYDDSLSYYEVLCKVKEKLNEVIIIQIIYRRSLPMRLQTADFLITYRNRLLILMIRTAKLQLLIDILVS